jgi:hypothetical protein
MPFRRVAEKVQNQQNFIHFLLNKLISGEIFSGSEVYPTVKRRPD